MATVTSAMDADFLKRTVGRPLSEALTSLVIAQPTDPIEFIGEALLDYIKRREDETTVRSNKVRKYVPMRRRSRKKKMFVVFSGCCCRPEVGWHRCLLL